MDDVRLLTGAQIASLTRTGIGSDLFYNPVDGNFLKHYKDNFYQIVATPYVAPPVLRGHREDSIIIDDVTITGTDGWFNSYLDGDSIRPGWLSKWMSEEEEMEIGGVQCHLCGAEILYNGISRTSVKKHRNVEEHKVYMCGTSILSTWKERGDNGYKHGKFDRHIHAECITHCC